MNIERCELVFHLYLKKKIGNYTHKFLSRDNDSTSKISKKWMIENVFEPCDEMESSHGTIQIIRISPSQNLVLDSVEYQCT